MEHRLLEEKFYIGEENIAWVLTTPWLPKQKYGFVAVKNPEYLKDKVDEWGYKYCDEREFLYRKPNAKERREIVINTIIESEGRPFSIAKLANLLAISDRTLQKLLKRLREEGLIAVSETFGKNGARRSNSYRYLDPPCISYGSGLNLHVLYDRKHSAGFRNWEWKDFLFVHDKVWHDQYDLCKLKFDAHVARRKYLEERHLPLIVPEEIKFLTLRYCYWKGENAVLNYAYECPCANYQYTQDGTFRIAIDFSAPPQTIRFFEHNLEVRFFGDSDNPQAEIIDKDNQTRMAVFSWFTENVIGVTTPIDEEYTEQYFILGDFTAK